jgi:polysaccharide export outer membrane protein
MRAGVYLLAAALFMQVAVLAAGEESPSGGAAGAAAGVEAASGPSRSEAYRICPGDVLTVTVDGEETLTRECQVNGAGTISYPLLGDVAAAGSNCGELRTRLEDGLKKYLKYPHVMITVRQYGQVGMSVFVMGEVQHPGLYPLASGSGLMQPLAAAGGMTELAGRQVTIMKARTGESRTVSLDEVGRNPAEVLLEPGDVILVEHRGEARYAVLGEVPAPGMFDIAANTQVRVLDAMTKAGLLPQASDQQGGATPVGIGRNLLDDPTRTADLEHSTITRGQTTIPVDLAALLRGDTSQNLVLQSGDVLTVPTRPLVRVFALGEVRTPGRESLPEGATVLDLLNAAGGTTTGARPSETSVLRMVEGKPTAMPVNLDRVLHDGDLTANMKLQDGDVLYVPPRGQSNQNAWRLLTVLPFLLP